MNRILKTSLAVVGTVLVAGAAAIAWYVHTKQPQRSGAASLMQLQAPVEVRYDERGVPHIKAANEADLYRALGYVHAQDRLFQMELMRRLSRGELAEVLGPKLLNTDKLFRTLGIRAHADVYAAAADKNSATWKALTAYLDGVNQFQASHPAPIEFDILGIPKRPFTPADTVSMAGYLAFSFAAALRTEPAMTYVRDKLGPQYLKLFDLDWHPEGMLRAGAATAALSGADWQALNRIAQASQELQSNGVVPLFEGSNAWAIAGSRTHSGKPILAGDPHIAYSAPAVWYEAQLSAPGIDLYGHFIALSPFALLGHNQRFGWSMTMFQNDDMDLVVEKPNPDNANQVWSQGKWVDMQTRVETITVKGEAPVTLALRTSPHGPIITDAYPDNYGKTPVAMWWAFLTTPNPVLEGLYQLNRADTLAKGREAASKIHAPGLNVVWANADGDIAWWAAALLPKRPDGVNPSFMLDGTKPEADKPGFHPFTDNPQEENPARGYVLSANAQPKPSSGVPVPGYYHPPARLQRLDDHLRDAGKKADVASSQAMQMDNGTDFGPMAMKPLLPVLQQVVTDPAERGLLDRLAAWKGDYALDKTEPTVFFQLLYELARGTMADEMGPVQFRNLLGTRALDMVLARLAADADSPWWDDRATPQVETRAQTLQKVWRATVDHLQTTFGKDNAQWTWGRAHTLTHNHPLGQQKPLDKLFSVGPFAAPGNREIPNAMGQAIGTAPWAVTQGPSTRRVIDFADASQALGGNPVGQSGVLFDRHYKDQAQGYVAGQYVREWLLAQDVAGHTQGTLTLSPAR